LLRQKLKIPRNYGSERMIKIYCDECGKEITNQDYVEQSILVNYDMEQSINVAVCKKCWNLGVSRMDARFHTSLQGVEPDNSPKKPCRAKSGNLATHTPTIDGEQINKTGGRPNEM